jgi:ATP-dependent Clp protease ATP-binding subunit ClpC
MWQRFTERARDVVMVTQEEAVRWGEDYVGTEHLLLGVIRDGDSVATRILQRIGLDRDAIRREIEPQMSRGPGVSGLDMLLTPRSRRVIDLAYEEERRLGNDYIGTEHLLLGLVTEGEGLAWRVLTRMGADSERVRSEVVAMQQEAPTPEPRKDQAP